MSVGFNLSAFPNLQKEVSPEMLAGTPSSTDAFEAEIEREMRACSDHPKYVAPKREREPLDTQCMEFALRALKEFNPAVHEFTRRILPAEKLEICQLIAEHKAYPTLEELRAFEKFEFRHPIFKHEEWPLFVLSALFMGKLSIEASIRLFLYDACRLQVADKKSIGRIVSFAEDDGAKEILRTAVKGYLSDAELNAFFERINQLPREETVFFTCRFFLQLDPKKFEKRDDATLKLVEALYHRVKFNLLLIPEPSCNRVTYVVLPPQLAHLLYSMKFGHQTVKPNPVLGLSRNAKNFEDPFKRDILIPCYYVNQPRKADGYSVTPVMFYYHDIVYHAWLDSSNPHRAAWIEIARLFKEKQKEFYIHFLDREFPLYAGIRSPFLEPLKLPDPNHLFCATLVQLIFQGTQDNCFTGDTIAVCQKIIMHVFENAARWQKEYGIFLSHPDKRYKPFNNIVRGLRKIKPQPKDEKMFKIWSVACATLHKFVGNAIPFPLKALIA